MYGWFYITPTPAQRSQSKSVALFIACTTGQHLGADCEGGGIIQLLDFVTVMCRVAGEWQAAASSLGRYIKVRNRFAGRGSREKHK